MKIEGSLKFTETCLVNIEVCTEIINFINLRINLVSLTVSTNGVIKLNSEAQVAAE